MICRGNFPALQLGIVMKNRAAIARVAYIELKTVTAVLQCIVERGPEYSLPGTQASASAGPGMAGGEPRDGRAATDVSFGYGKGKVRILVSLAANC